MKGNSLLRKITMLVIVVFMFVGSMTINIRAEDDDVVDQTVKQTNQNTSDEVGSEEVFDEIVEEVSETDEVQEEITEEISETENVDEEITEDTSKETQSEEVTVEQIDELEEEEIVEETEEETQEVDQETTVDPNKQYEYRLIVGFADEVNTRDEDVVLGNFDKVVLIGFDSIDELDDAKQYYTENALFASVDGVLSVSDNESSPVDVDTAQSSASETASVEENPLSEANETEAVTINAKNVIALIDTGANGGNVYQQLSVLGENVEDENGHGSSLALLIGELNPDAKILSIKALNENGTGTVASVYVAIKLAIDSNVDYIVCPFSALGNSEAIRNIVVEAVNKGIMVIVSAGNDGQSAINYCPANIEEAITVGALDENDQIAEFSNSGSMVDVWVQADSTSEAAVILTAKLTLGRSLSDFEMSFDMDYGDQLPTPIDGDNVEFHTTYKTTTDSLTDGGIYIIRLRKNPYKSIVQQTGGYTNGNKFVLSNADKREDSSGQFKLSKINYNYYFILRDNTSYIMSPEGGADYLGTNGQKVHMWAKTSSNYKDFDQWWMKSNGNYYRITNGKNTGMHLQTDGGNTTGNTYLHLWNATSGEQGDWIFERVWYNVQFNPNGGSGSSYTQKFWQEEKKALSSNTFTRTGYTFNGWNTNSSGTGTNYSNGQSVQTLTATNAATFNLYAKWKANTYYVAYNGNGSTGGSMSNSTHTYNTSMALTANAYSRNGYTFNGWNTKSDGTGTSYTNSQSVNNLTSTSGGTVTLYAQWKPNTYTVSYNGNGSTSGSTASSSHTYDVAKKLTSNGFSKTGYTFGGWNTNSAGTGTSYSDGQSVSNLTTTNGGTVTLYAKWTPITYFVTYSGNEATGGSTIDSTHKYNEASALSTNGYTRTGYTFDGWNTHADGSGTNYTDGQSVTNLSSVNNAHVTLYAKWKANTYTVKYNGNGADGGSTESSSHVWNETKTLTTNGFTRTGYKFNGWNSTAAGTGTSYAQNDPVKNLTPEAGGTYNLYAKWVPNKYALALDNHSADSSGTEMVYYLYELEEYYSDEALETAIAAIELPQRTGYIFDGYYDEVAGEGTKYIDVAGNFINDPYKLTGSTLYANWIAEDYTVSLDANGGELAHGTENPYNAEFDELITIHHPHYEGYTFKGWNIANMEEGITHSFGDHENTAASANNINETTFKNLRASEGVVDFTAQWQPNKYTVALEADGGILDPADVVQIIATYDEEFTVKSPIKDGHVFHGWKIEDMHGSKHYIDDIETSETEYTYETDKKEVTFKNLNTINGAEVDLIAQWAEAEYKVIYNLNGGSLDGIDDGQEVIYGYDHTFTVLNPTRAGYTFDGWEVTGMNEGTSHLVGGEETSAAEVGGVEGVSFGRLHKDGGTVTLTATWESDEIVVILSAPEANPEPDYTKRIYYTYEVPEYFVDPEHTTPLVEPLTVPERNNYIFTGFFDSTDGSGEAIVDVEGIIHGNLSSMYPAPHNLYAGWDPVVYEITLSQEDATTKGTEAIYEKYNTGIYMDEAATTAVTTITVPIKEVTVSFDGNGVSDPADMNVALTFDGYFDGDIALIGQAGQLLPAFVGTYFDSDTSIEAKFSKTTIALPTPEDREGYSFDGWYTQDDQKVGGANDIYDVTESTTLVAKWDEDPKLIYDKNASDATGTVANSTAKKGKLVNIAENSYERKGYSFVSWNTSADGNGTNYNANSSVIWNEELQGDSYTLYAKWESNKFVSIQPIDDHPFTGSDITTDITVIDDKGNVVDPDEYELTWQNNKNVGTATVIATPKTDGNYKTSEAVSATFKIVKAPYSQFNEKKENYTGVYDGIDHAVKVTANSEDTDHFYKIGYGLSEQEAKDNALAQASSAKTNTGHNVKDVKDSGTVYYYIIPDNYEEYAGTLTANITPKELTISGINGVERQYDGTTDVELSGQATLVGVVDYDDVDIDDSGLAVAAANKNAGSQKVIISGYELTGTEMDNYTLAQPENVTVTINKKPLSFSWSGGSYTYDGNSKVYEGATIVSSDIETGDNVTIASYSGNIQTDAGDYEATVTALSGSDSVNYSIGDDASHEWSIAKATNTASVSMNGWTYGKQANDPVLTATYGKETATYQYSKDGETWNNDKPTDAGEYTVRASIPAGSNYDECVTTAEFTIAKADITVRANDATSVRNQPLVENIGFEVSGDFVEADLNTLKDLIKVETNANYVHAGKYKTEASYEAGEADNYNVTFVNGVYTVTRNDSIVNAQEYNGTYDGEEHTISVSVTGDENAKIYYCYGEDSAVEDAIEAMDNSYDSDEFENAYRVLANALNDSTLWKHNDPPKYSQAGTNTVRYIVITDESKPDAIEGQRDVVINKALLTSTAENNEITYGGIAEGNGVTYSGFVNGEDKSVVDESELAYDINYSQYNDAGTYTITPKGLKAANYTFTYKDGTLTVNPLAVELTWSPNPTQFTHNGSTYMVSAVVSNALNGDEVSVATYTNNVDSAEGEYTAEATSLAGSKAKNYTLTNGTNLTYDWSIVNKNNNVSVTIADWTYGDTPSTPKITADYNQSTGTVKYYTLDGDTYTECNPVDAGTYYVKATVPSDGYYLVGESEYVPFKIDKKEISILVDSKISRHANTLLPLTYNLSDTLVNAGDLGEIKLSTTATKDSVPGDYEIDATYTDNDNYNVSVVKGTYTITKASLKATVSGYEGTYDGERHGITLTLDPRVTDKATVYYSTDPLTSVNFETGTKDPEDESVTRKDVGTTTVYFYVDSLYYASEPVTGSQNITINQKALTVKANDNTVDYGSDPVDAGVTYDGLIASDEGKIGTITYNYKNYEKGSDVGDYEIEISGLTTDNYAITYQSGNLKVNQLIAKFNWDQDTFDYNGSSQSPTAEISNKFGDDDVTVGSYNGNVETVVGSYVAEAVTLSGTKAHNYKISGSEASTTHNWKIVQVDNTWVEEPEIDDWTYGLGPNEPSATPRFGGPVIFEYKKVGQEDRFYSTEPPTLVGEYIMRATVIRDDNYRHLAKTVVFNVNPSKVKVELNDQTSPHGSSINELTYELTGDYIVESELGIVPSTTATSLSHVGEYPITATWDNNPNYEVTIVDGTYNIVKANLRITAENTTATYDGNDHGITVTITEPSVHDAIIWYSDKEITAENLDTIEKTDDPLDDLVSLADVGEKTVYWYVESKNYGTDPEDPQASISGSNTVTVKKHDLTIYVNEQDIIYGDEANAGKPHDIAEGITYTIPTGCEDDIDFGEIHYDYNYNQYDDIGNYEITVTADSVKSNKYNITFEKGTLVVSPRPITFTWTDENGGDEPDYEYDGNSHHVVAIPQTVNNDELGQLTYENNSAVDAGGYTARVTHLPEGGKADNYVLQEGEATASRNWDIKQAKNEWLEEGKIDDWTYGKPKSTPTSKAKFGDSSKKYLYRSVETETWSEEVPTQAGEYILMIKVEETDNYLGLETEIKFDILKAEITVTADNQSSRYLENTHTLTATITGDYVQGDDLGLKYTCDVTSESDLGEYPIAVEVTNKDALNNYEVTDIDGTYTITRTELSITVEGYEGNYDGKEYGITVTVDQIEHAEQAEVYYSSRDFADLINLDALRNDTTGDVYDQIHNKLNVELADVVHHESDKISSVADSPKKEYYLLLSRNYNILTGYEEIILHKVPLTITAHDNEASFGDNPKDDGVSYNGFVNNETEDVLDGTLTLDINYKQYDPVGEYTITPSGLTSANYDIEYVDGRLKVNPVHVTDERIRYTIKPSYEDGFVYDGLEHSPTISLELVKDTDGNDISYPLVEGRDYNITGELSSDEFGVHQISINGMGNFDNYLTDSWQINGTRDIEEYDEGNGKVIIETDVNSHGIKISVDDLTKDIAESVLSEDDLYRVTEEGETAHVFLEINVIEQLPEEDADITEDKLDELGATACVYLDIKLFKKVGDDDVVQVDEMISREVTITVEIPEEYHNKDKNIIRTFHVLRAHKGLVQLLASSTDTVITFKSGLFSSYTMGYTDKKVSPRGDDEYRLPLTGVDE